jgi:hypothetical protein
MRAFLNCVASVLAVAACVAVVAFTLFMLLNALARAAEPPPARQNEVGGPTYTQVGRDCVVSRQGSASVERGHKCPSR